MKANINLKNWKGEVVISTRAYQNGRTAIILADADTGEPVTVATVNLPDIPMLDTWVCIKSWSENEGMADELERLGVIGPAITVAPTGYVTATIHQLLLP